MSDTTNRMTPRPGDIVTFREYTQRGSRRSMAVEIKNAEVTKVIPGGTELSIYDMYALYGEDHSVETYRQLSFSLYDRIQVSVGYNEHRVLTLVPDFLNTGMQEIIVQPSQEVPNYMNSGINYGSMLSSY